MTDADAKIVLITGATRGLGQALTVRFVESGHTVVGCGRSLNAIKQLESRHGQPHRFDCIDVSNDAEVASWARSVIAGSGAPDLLLNNAGTINANAALWKITADDFSEVVDVNIKGVANVIRHFVPAMIERGMGVIVNFSSGWGRSTAAEMAPYCATKWAIEGLTGALAQDLPDFLSAVALNPGIINTEMLQSCFGSSASHHPEPQEWSRSAVPFLLQLGTRHNGESLTVPM